jgi:hypothetical protein
MGAATYGITRLFGTGVLGPLVVSLVLLMVILAIFARRLQRGSPLTATSS